GTHWMWNKDMGHIYDRSWKQHYTSRVFEWKKSRKHILIKEEASLNGDAKLEVYIRSSPFKETLTEAPWRLISGELEISKNDRFLQYRYIFKSENGDAYPILKSVSVNLK